MGARSTRFQQRQGFEHDSLAFPALEVCQAYGFRRIADFLKFLSRAHGAVVDVDVHYHARSKVIGYAWVNDADTKRAYESRDDACRVFRKMLESGHPPDDWERLLSEARAESDQLQQVRAKATREIDWSSQI